MIEATVNKGEVFRKIDEITVLVDCILDVMVKDCDMEKGELVNLVCRGLNHINGEGK